MADDIVARCQERVKKILDSKDEGLFARAYATDVTELLDLVRALHTSVEARRDMNQRTLDLNDAYSAHLRTVSKARVDTYADVAGDIKRMFTTLFKGA